MNDLKDIKKYIFDKDLIQPLLESLGCDNIRKRSNRYEARRPNGNNSRSVQVYLSKKLKCRIRTKAHLPDMDIFGLVSYIRHGKETHEEMKNDLNRSKQFILSTLNISNDVIETKQIPDYNFFLRKAQQKRKKRQFYLSQNPVLSENVLNEFIQLPHIKFIEDGIDYQTQIEFEIGFDIATERITIPIRNKYGQLVGVKGRRTNPNNEAKYLFIYPFQKSKELFNLYRAVDEIRRTQQVILVESEKSVLKLWQYNYRNAVSQMGSEISDYQVELLYRICPDLQVVCVYDKDKTIFEIKQMVKPFKNRFNKIYATYDRDNILQDKESPADRQEAWEYIYHNNVYEIKLK